VQNDEEGELQPPKKEVGWVPTFVGMMKKESSSSFLPSPLRQQGASAPCGEVAFRYH